MREITMLGLFSIIIFFSVLLLLPSTQAQQKLALVIGNKDYKNISVLKNPLNDANDIYDALVKLDFDVTLGKNLDYDQMIEAVRGFSKKIKKGDIALFYYAGHGVQAHNIQTNNSENYLIPLKADIQKETEVHRKSISADWVLSELQSGVPILKIMILDACRDNPYRSFRGWSRKSSRGMARVGLVQMEAGGSGTIIAMAADKGQKAEDGSGRNGVYTKELLKQLPRSGVQAVHMFGVVSRKVSESKAQVPFVSIKAPPSFCFAGCKADEAEEVERRVQIAVARLLKEKEAAGKNNTKTIKEKKEEPVNVFELQRRLRELGYYKGEIDGIVGIDTREALQKYMKNRK